MIILVISSHSQLWTMTTFPYPANAGARQFYILNCFVFFCLIFTSNKVRENLHRRWSMCPYFYFILFFPSKELISMCTEAVSKGLQRLFQDFIQASETC